MHCPAVSKMGKDHLTSFHGAEAEVPVPKAKEAAQKSPSSKAAADYYHDMEGKFAYFFVVTIESIDLPIYSNYNR